MRKRASILLGVLAVGLAAAGTLLQMQASRAAADAYVAATLGRPADGSAQVLQLLSVTCYVLAPLAFAILWVIYPREG